jgi:hypothetical protein
VRLGKVSVLFTEERSRIDSVLTLDIYSDDRWRVK